MKQADVSDVTKEGSNEFMFKVGGHKHTFQAGNAAERDSWVVAIEAKAAEAKAEKDNITTSEGYKAELEKLTKPAVPATIVKKIENKEETAAKEDKKEEAKEEKKDEKATAKSRSQSRKRASIFGSLLGKKEETAEEKKEEQKAEDKKEATEEDKATEPAAEASTEAPAAATTESRFHPCHYINSHVLTWL